MDPQETRSKKLEGRSSEDLQAGLDSRRIAGRNAIEARAILARREREEAATYLFPVPPRSFFRLSENTKATVVLIAQIVAAVAATAAAVIAYFAWISPRLPH